MMPLARANAAMGSDIVIIASESAVVWRCFAISQISNNKPAVPIAKSPSGYSDPAKNTK